MRRGDLQFGDGTDNVTYPIRELPWSVEREVPREPGAVPGAARRDGQPRRRSRQPRTSDQRAAAARGPPPAGASCRTAGRVAARAAEHPTAEMDRDRNGVITRQEWRGSQRSFEVHDWNGDGRLAGRRSPPGATWPNRNQGQNQGSRARVLGLERGAVPAARSQRRHPDFANRVGPDRHRRLHPRRPERRQRARRCGSSCSGTWTTTAGDRFAYLDINNNTDRSLHEWHGGEPALPLARSQRRWSAQPCGSRGNRAWTRALAPATAPA